MKKAQKNWWKSFFKPITAEVMFKSREGKQTALEVDEVLRQAKIKEPCSVLDLACGEGRHSIELAQRGFDVIGLDYAKNFLDVAKIRAQMHKLEIGFVRGDMKETSKHFEKNSFDLVVSLYNSFGFFDKRSDDLKTLKEVSKVLKPGGYFVINTINGEGAKHRLAKPLNAGYEISKNVFMIDQANLDLKKMRTQSHWTIIDARKKKTEITRGSFSQNVYSHKEMKAMLKTAGFRVVNTWGLLAGGKFDEKTSWHQTVVAQKIAKKRS